VDEIRDLNRSGGILTRPGLAQAKQLVPNTATGIVVARADRASRRALHGLGLIDELAELGGWIAAADGTIDTSTRTAKMATTMHFAMGENELERYRETSAVVHRRAIVEKGRHMGPAPFGYTRDSDGRLVVDEDRAPFARLVFERRAEGAGWVQISRELAQRGVRQHDGRYLNPYMLRRMVRRRVYVGEAHHGEHVHHDAHPAIIEAGLWAAANRSTPAVRSAPAVKDRAHSESLLRGLLRCAGCRYVLKRQPGRRGEHPRWLCRTVLTNRDATHDCEQPVRVRQSESAAIEEVVLKEFFRLATGVAAERSPDATSGDAERRLADAERRLADAEALLDELSSLEVRRSLGAERWNRMVSEARDDVERAEQEVAGARAMTRVGSIDVATLEEGWAGMTLPERQDALRSIVQAVMVEAGDAPVAERVHVAPVWEAVDLPRKGAQGFVARPFRVRQD
jgi:DNA invertase Pin-like site-specific DNA recombinase